MECILIHIKDGTVTIRAAGNGMQIMVWDKVDDTSTQLLAAVKRSKPEGITEQTSVGRSIPF